MWFNKKKENNYDRWKPENIDARMNELGYIQVEEPENEIKFTADRNNLILFRSLEREDVEAKTLTFNTVDEFRELFNNNAHVAVWKVNIVDDSAMYYQSHLNMLELDKKEQYITFSITLFHGDEGIRGKTNIKKEYLVDMLTGFPETTKVGEEVRRLKNTYNTDEIKEIIRNLI